MRKTLHRRETLLLGAALSFTSTNAISKPNQAALAVMPKEPRPDLKIYASQPAFSFISLSPDGKRIAYITWEGDKQILVHFKVEDQKLVQALVGDIFVAQLYFITPDILVIATSKNYLTNKYQPNFDFFYYDTSKGNFINPFSKLSGIANINESAVASVSSFNRKGVYGLIIPATNTNQHDTGTFLYEVDIETKNTKRLFQDFSFNGDWVITADGRPIAYDIYDGFKNVWDLYYNQADPDKPSAFKKIFSISNTFDPPQLLGLGRDGKSVVVKFDEDANGGDYFEIDPMGAKSNALDAGGTRGRRTALFHPTTRCLAGFSREDDWFSYDYFDPLMKKLAAAVPKIIGEGYRTSIADIADDPRKMILYSEGPDDAGSFYYYDFATGQNIVLGTNYPDIPVSWIVEKKPITYKAADGLDIHGYLTLPVGKPAKNLPLIVLPHGGPEVRDYGGFDWQSQALASLGYCVLQPNYRGSDGYGTAFIRAGDGQWGRKALTDLSDGVRHLVAQGIADAKRVAIFGASYGGYAALAGATLDPGVYRCAISVAGMSHLRSMLDFDTEKYGAGSIAIKRVKRMLGDLKTIDEISPVNHAAKASCPILLLHGKLDLIVDISQSRRMASALKAAGKPHEYVEFKNQNHQEANVTDRIEMMNLVVAFLEKHMTA